MGRGNVFLFEDNLETILNWDLKPTILKTILESISEA